MDMAVRPGLICSSRVHSVKVVMEGQSSKSDITHHSLPRKFDNPLTYQDGQLHVQKLFCITFQVRVTKCNTADNASLDSLTLEITRFCIYTSNEGTCPFCKRLIYHFRMYECSMAKLTKKNTLKSARQHFYEAKLTAAMVWFLAQGLKTDQEGTKFH